MLDVNLIYKINYNFIFQKKKLDNLDIYKNELGY